MLAALLGWPVLTYVVPVIGHRGPLIGTISEPGPNRPVYFRPDGSQFTW